VRSVARHFDEDDGVIGVDDDQMMGTAPLGVVSGAVVGVLMGLSPRWCRAGWIDANLVQPVAGFGDSDAGGLFIDDGVAGGEGSGRRV
jgi:hypothetical protein